MPSTTKVIKQQEDMPASIESDVKCVFQLNTDMIYVRQHVHAFEEDSLSRLIKRYNGEDIEEWIEGPSEKNCSVFYAPVQGSDWYTMKASTVMNITMERAVQVLNDKDEVPKFDENTDRLTILEQVSDRTQIRLVSCKSVFFTTARDFCVATTVQRGVDGKTLIATTSVDHEDGRDRSGYVRALSLISGYIISPVENHPEQCEITLLAHMDLGGYLPGAVISFLGLSAPIKMLTTLRELVE